jgi:hypothetical protein
MGPTRDVIHYVESTQSKPLRFNQPPPSTTSSNKPDSPVRVQQPQMAYSNPFGSGIQTESTIHHSTDNHNDAPLYPTHDMMPAPVHYNGPASPTYPTYEIMPSPVHYDSSVSSTLYSSPYPPVLYNNQPYTPTGSPKVENTQSSKLEDPFSHKEEYVQKPHEDIETTHDKPHS